MKNF
jgi:hypothetical protein